jgi:hypothetical protein
VLGQMVNRERRRAHVFGGRRPVPQPHAAAIEQTLSTKQNLGRESQLLQGGRVIGSVMYQGTSYTMA